MRLHRFGTLILLVAALGLAPARAAAQGGSATLSAGSGSGQPGQSVTIPISLTSQGGAQVAGVNFDLNFDEKRLSVSSVTAGSAATAAGKSVSSSEPSPGKLRVIVFGVNQNVIGSGTIVNITFSILGSAAPGTVNLTFSNTAATDPSGNSVPVNTQAGSVTVNAPPATATPPPTATSPPTATAPPTNTPAPTDTPRPTSTSAPGATATHTPTPGSGTGPQPTATHTPAPSGPTATPGDRTEASPTPGGLPASTAAPTGQAFPTPTMPAGTGPEAAGPPLAPPPGEDLAPQPPAAFAGEASEGPTAVATSGPPWPYPWIRGILVGNRTADILLLLTAGVTAGVALAYRRRMRKGRGT